MMTGYLHGLWGGILQSLVDQRRGLGSKVGGPFRFRFSRPLKGFPFAERFHGSCPVGTVSLIGALLIVPTEVLAVTGLFFEPRKTAFQQLARLGQGQGRGFFLIFYFETDQEQLYTEYQGH